MNPWYIPERVHSVTSAPYLSGGMNSSFPQCKSALNLYWISLQVRVRELPQPDGQMYGPEYWHGGQVEGYLGFNHWGQ